MLYLIGLIFEWGILSIFKEIFYIQILLLHAQFTKNTDSVDHLKLKLHRDSDPEEIILPGTRTKRIT